MKERPYQQLGQMLLMAAGYISQNEIAKWLGVTQPAVNMWFNGERRPEPTSLVQLADHLKLDILKLAGAGKYDVVEVIEVYENAHLYSRDFDFLRELETQMKQVRISGNAQSSIDMGNTVLGMLCHFPNQSPEVVQMRARILYEQSWAYKEIHFPDKIKVESRRIVAEIEKLAKIHKDLSIYELARLIEGDTLYILKEPEESASVLQQTLIQGHLRSTEPEQMLLRALSLDAAYLGKPELFDLAYKEVKPLIISGKYDTYENGIQLLEGVGRSQGLLGRVDEALENFEIIDSLIRLAESDHQNVPLREVQAYRSKAAVLLESDPTNKNEIEKNIAKGIEIAHNKYERHEQQLKDMANKGLN